jgi:uncharacterized protein (TIGR02186 family)
MAGRSTAISAAVAFSLLAITLAGHAAAQTAPRARAPVAAPAPAAAPAAAGEVRPETVESDVSTRSVAITAAFSGTQIVVFGAVGQSRQQSAEAGLYDIVVLVEGVASPLVTRRKSNVAGLWINTESVHFDRLPSYYGISSTRPIEEIAEPAVLDTFEIGFEHVRMMPAAGQLGLSEQKLKDYRAAVVRLKEKDSLYVRNDYGVAFIGKSLFRASVSLPANIPVGPVTANVFLFRDGRFLARHTARVELQREGFERWMHAFAFEFPFFYGLFSVAIAAFAGIAASALFRRGSH